MAGQYRRSSRSGFPDGISGNDLADRTHRQAERLGAEILVGRQVVEGLDAEGAGMTVHLDSGQQLRAAALVCATGVDWRRLDVPGLDALEGRGVYYGAATSEAPGVKRQHIVIVGGGNSAGQAALFFAEWATSVTIAVRGAGLAATLSDYLLQRIESHPRITVCTQAEVVGVTGQDWLHSVTLCIDGRTEDRPAHALFVCIGGVPRTEWAGRAGVAADAAGYLLTGPGMLRYDAERRDPAGPASEQPRWPLERQPALLETSRPGLFAMGDVRHGSTKRIATAMGEGALVVTQVQALLAARPPAMAPGE